MSKIYKYTSLESAVSILNSDSVVLKHPFEFNDLYDCVFKQNEKDKKRIRKLLKDYTVLSIMVKLTETEGAKDAGPVRFVNAELSVLKKALRKVPYYDGSPGLVFLYNQMAKKKPDIAKTFEEAFDKYQKQLDDAIEDARKNALISCFSKRKDSLLMWSHYADSHKGVCIEYERPNNDDFLDVIYQAKRSEAELYKAVSHAIALSIMSGGDLEDARFENIKELAKPFLVKSLDWKYEEEIRCLYSSNEYEKYGIVFDGKRYFINIGKPTSIYIGCRCDGSQLQKLIKEADKKNMRIVFMQQSDKYFSVEEQNG